MDHPSSDPELAGLIDSGLTIPIEPRKPRDRIKRRPLVEAEEPITLVGEPSLMPGMVEPAGGSSGRYAGHTTSPLLRDGRYGEEEAVGGLEADVGHLMLASGRRSTFRANRWAQRHARAESTDQPDGGATPDRHRATADDSPCMPARWAATTRWTLPLGRAQLQNLRRQTRRRVVASTTSDQSSRSWCA
jgi:hypothetical protein